MTASVDDRRTLAARNATMLVFAVNGFAFASWMSRVPDVREALALTPGELGLLLLSISAGALCGLPLAGRVTHRIGAQATVRVGMGLMVSGLVLAAIAAEAHAGMYWVAPGLFLVGLGSGVWDVAQNVEGTIVERLPPRMEIRRGAPLELPHIMLLVDDPERSIRTIASGRD